MPNQYTTQRVFIECAQCGVTFRIKPYEASFAKFCSRACKDAQHPIKHGDARNGQRAREYDIWCAMLARCLNPSNQFYADYGGRGIMVCDAWRVYESFIADVGRRPSSKHQLDRIDNDKGYAPDNVQWATVTRQQRNKRDNAWLTVGGITRLRVEWAEQLGIPHSTVRNRLAKGWTPEQALGIEPRHASFTSTTTSPAREISTAMPLSMAPITQLL